MIFLSVIACVYVFAVAIVARSILRRLGHSFVAPERGRLRIHRAIRIALISDLHSDPTPRI